MICDDDDDDDDADDDDDDEWCRRWDWKRRLMKWTNMMMCDAVVYVKKKKNKGSESASYGACDEQLITVELVKM